jgi:glycosyltransferase involved in cell wall biosynthesis
MKIVFVHQNFPGQFVHVAPALRHRGHEVLALTASVNQKPSPVTLARYRWEEPEAFPNTAQFRLLQTYATMMHRAERVAAAALALKNQHAFNPDVVIGTIGWGETLFLREIWPEARHVGYGEFFYRPQGLDVGFDPEFSPNTLATRIKVTARQAHLLLGLNNSDQLISPTHWQARSFPDAYQGRIHVLHDGIDTETACPDDSVTFAIPGTHLAFRRGDPLLTYVSRNLEPYRGFHIFMRSLPRLLYECPKAHVVIVGDDGVGYGPPPPNGDSWKNVMLNELADRLDASRIHLIGRIPYPKFLDLMRVSRAHTYLSYPFVLSWSMLEAMSVETLVIGSRTPPVEEVIEHNMNGLLVDFFDTEALSKQLVEIVKEPHKFDDIRRQARRTICERYDLRNRCLPQMVSYLENLAQRPSCQ